MLDAEGPLVGVVVNQATGVHFEAVRGGGARRDGAGLTPSGCAELSSALVGISGYPGVHPGWAQFRAFGAAALEFCAVAEGTLDAYSVVGTSTLFGWDYLAGMLICTEAGAVTKERDGIDVVVRDATTRRPIVAATPDAVRPIAGEVGHVSEGSAGPLLARKTWRTLEPLHGMIYFVPEAAEAYARLGITGRSGYFASRAAPMGAVAPEVVVSTFFNFNPELVYSSLPRAWQVASPEAILAARLEAVDAAFRRVLGSAVGSPEMRRAAVLARGMAEIAGTHVEGRPLCAGHADLPWPDEPHLVLWHAQSVLREFRGDGHIALLVTHGLSGIEALITHGAAGEAPIGVLRATRGWPDDAWHAAVAALQERGWLREGDEVSLTGWGAAMRHEIEEQTDVLASVPYLWLGEEDCAELRALARPWSRLFAEALPL